MVIFGINFPPNGYIPLFDLYTIIAWGSASQNYTSMPNLTIVALKMWPYGPTAKNGNFW